MDAPQGLGDFTGSDSAGSGTAYIETRSMWDTMIPVWVEGQDNVRITYRMRQKGFDHGMPHQDIKDSIGGLQSNHRDSGGVRAYAYATFPQGWRQVAITTEVDNGSGNQAMAANTIQAYKRDLTNYDDVQALGGGENVLALMNGNFNIGLLTGDGSLKLWGKIKAQGLSVPHGEWTPTLQSGHSITGEVYYTELADRVLFNGLASLPLNSNNDELVVSLPFCAANPVSGGGHICATNSGRSDGLLVANTAPWFRLYSNNGVAAKESDYSGKWFYFEGQYKKE